MRFVKGRSLNVRLVLTLSAALLAPLPAPAQALPANDMRSVAVSTWANLYAGASNGTPTASPAPKATAAKSTFVVNYSVNFPTSAKTAFDKAVEIWSANFASTVPITIDASWTRLSPGVLGSAKPTRLYTNFENSPSRDLWYTGAMANAIAGRDLDSTANDITANFSSSAPWSFNTSATPQRGYYDFVTVVLHELGHGLGFLSTSYLNPTGTAILEQPTPFDAFTKPDFTQLRLADLPSEGSDLARALTAPLTWVGTRAAIANGGIAPKLYSPQTYESGSSTSHLDEATFGGSANALMTPVLDAAEVIYDPGPVTLGIFADMFGTPPSSPVTTAPTSPQNATAITGERSAIISFDPPKNNRTSQVETYTIEAVGGSVKPITVNTSPAVFPGLRAGSSYVFTVKANNAIGSSQPAYTNSIVVSATWKVNTIDPKATGTFTASTTWRGQPTLVYTDTTSGDLKMGIWNGKKWSIRIVDGNDATNGRTDDDVSGAVSACVTGAGKTQVLHVFYSDLNARDLRHAAFDGRRFRYETIDGDSPTGQAVEDTNRVRTNSDVSVSNACVATPDGLQVFYRDESLGILLGAVNKSNGWRYELIDGDRDKDGRTTGDVAFRLQAINVGRTVHLIYDSVRSIDSQRNPTLGDVRYATRTGTGSWRYLTLESASNSYPVAGYDVAIGRAGSTLYAAWLAATPGELGTPQADTLRVAQIGLTGAIGLRAVLPNGFGSPKAPLAINGRSVAYGCEGRLCLVNATTGAKALISGQRLGRTGNSTWLNSRARSGIVVSLNGRLVWVS